MTSKHYIKNRNEIVRSASVIDQAYSVKQWKRCDIIFHDCYGNCRAGIPQPIAAQGFSDFFFLKNCTGICKTQLFFNQRGLFKSGKQCLKVQKAKKKAPKSIDFRAECWSCYPDSNWGPHPYQPTGDLDRKYLLIPTDPQKPSDTNGLRAFKYQSISRGFRNILVKMTPKCPLKKAFAGKL